jgi:hypothetical protein
MTVEKLTSLMDAMKALDFDIVEMKHSGLRLTLTLEPGGSVHVERKDGHYVIARGDENALERCAYGDV